MLRQSLLNARTNLDAEDDLRHSRHGLADQDSFSFDARPQPLIVSQSARPLLLHTDVTPSPSSSAEVSFISGVDDTGHVVATSFATWKNNDPATYNATTSNVAKWGAPTAGTTGGTIKFYFDSASSWNATEKAEMTSCLSLWATVANIKFALTTDSSQAQIEFTRGNPGDGAFTSGGQHGSGTPGAIGGTNLWTFGGISGPQQIVIDTAAFGFGPMDGNLQTAGGYVFGTIIHELGHALGLGHGGAYNGDVDPTVQQFSAFDTLAYSIMSYIEPGDDTAKFFSQYAFNTAWGTTDVGGGSTTTNTPTTMMMLDILALQQLYGAPTASVLDGGEVFGFHTNIAGDIQKFFDFNVNTRPIITIYDTGTGNRLDLSGYSTAATVDLNPGTFSSCAGLTNNLCIALNTRIDNYTGTSNIDIVTANANDDVIHTASGNDIIDFGATMKITDSVDGGGGVDTVNLDGQYNNLDFSATTMTNVETVHLAAGHDYTIRPDEATVAAGKTLTIDGSGLILHDILTFIGTNETNGSFVIKGGGSSDTITGGSGNDTIDGGVGFNIVRAYKGADVITVASGRDTLVYKAANESTHNTFDRLIKFDFNNNDHIDLGITVAGINTTVTGGSLSTATFDADLVGDIGAAKLGVHDAVIFKPTAGGFANATFLVVDLNGVAGYQAGADLVLQLQQALHLTSLDTTDFV